MCKPRGYASVLRWSFLGLAASITQMATIAAMFAEASFSQGLLACLIFSVIFLVLYFAYLVVVRRLHSGVATWTPPHLLKYFLILHLLFATWYYWSAIITFVLHSAGFQVWDVLFDDDGKDQFTNADTVLSVIMFVVTAVSLAVDAYGVRFHTLHSGLLPQQQQGGAFSTSPGAPAYSPGGSSRPRSGVWRRKPRASSVVSAVVDGLMLLCTIQALVMQGDPATVALLILLILSIILQSRYAWRCTHTTFLATSDWHLDSQMLLLQHMLVVSTTFLVDMLLLLSHAVGRTFGSMLAGRSGDAAATLAFSLLSYVAIAASTVLLVALHTQVETGDLSTPNLQPLPSSSSSGGFGYTALATVVPVGALAHPVPLALPASAVRMGSTGSSSSGRGAVGGGGGGGAAFTAFAGVPRPSLGGGDEDPGLAFARPGAIAVPLS